MSRRHLYLTLEECETGTRITHAAGDPGGNYATLCSCSADDALYRPVPTPRNARIDCEFCKRAFDLAREFRASDFAEVLR